MTLRSLLATLLKNRVAKNASWIIAGRIAQMCVSFVVGLLTARYLGPSNQGLLSYGGAYTAFFTSFCTLGINDVIVRELISRPDKQGEVLGTSMVLREISSVLSVFVILMVVLIVDGGEQTTIAVVALCSIGVVFNVLDIFQYWFQASLKSKVTAITSLVAYIITAAYKVVLLATGKSVIFFALASSVDYICIGVLLMIAYHRHGGQKLRFSWLYGKKLLKNSTPFILTGLMVAVYGQTDKYMLKQMIGSSEIGFYSTAVSLCTIWCFVLSAIIQSMYPVIMEAFERSEEEFLDRNRLLYAIVFYLCISVSIFFTLFARPIISILYGESYLPTVGPLRIITWYTAFSYLGVARNAWIVCKNRQRYLKYVYVGAAIANVILNLLLIPRWGASGAAAASLAAQIITTMVIPFFIPALRENSMLMLESIRLKGILKKKSQ